MSVIFGKVTIAGVPYKVLITKRFDTFKYWFTNQTIKAYDIQGVYLKLYFRKITTKKMEFPIDIIFLDKKNNVLKRIYNIIPGKTVIAPKHSKYALELLPDISI